MSGRTVIYTVVPLYTAPLTSCHPSYAANLSCHGQYSLYICPSPTATPLTRPAASNHLLGVSNAEFTPLSTARQCTSDIRDTLGRGQVSLISDCPLYQ